MGEQERQKRMLSMLLGSQASLVVKSTFSAWQEMLYNLKKERELERIKFAMNSKNDAHTKKMLGLLMGSQVELLVKSIFSAWSELVTEARKEREMEEMKRSMKAKGAEHTKRMLGMLIGSQDQTLLKMVLSGWQEILAEIKKTRETERVKAAMKAKGEESTKRMLAMLMGSQMDVMKKAAFSGWWEHVAEEKQHNAMRELQQNMRAKGAESNKRMLGMLLGAQAETLLKASFAGWSELHVAAKMERMREDKLKMRSKEDESRRRMLGMLVGSQSSLIMKMAFAGWSDSHYEAKKLQEVERMRRDMKSKGDESTKRMLGMLMGSQANLMEKAAFSAWQEVLMQKKEDARIEQVRLDMKAKGAESSKG